MTEKELKEMNIAEDLNTAIYNERLACERYRDIAVYLRKAGNDNGAEFFTDQANRELGHYNSLMKYKEKNGIESDTALGESMKWVSPESVSGEDIPSNIDLESALHLVDEKELASERFYRDAARKVGDQELADLYNKLADDEARHHYLIQKLKTIYETKGQIEPIDYQDLGFE